MKLRKWLKLGDFITTKTELNNDSHTLRYTVAVAIGLPVVIGDR